MSKKPSGPRRLLNNVKVQKTSGSHRSKEYEVGYGRPPKSGQFKPGHKGHPKAGRPKGSRNLATKFDAVLSRKVALTENGKRRMIEADEAILHRYLELALKGNVKTGAFLLGWRQQLQPQEIDEIAEDDLSERDKKIMRNFIERLGKAKKKDDDDKDGSA